MNLPDPLLFENGQPVTSPDEWPARRAELLELFRAQVYGRAPLQRPDDLTFEVLETQTDDLGGAATRKQIEIRFGGFSFGLKLLIPNSASRPAPCFVFANNRSALSADAVETQFWPAQTILERGYATAVFDMAQLDPDFDDGFKNGVHSVYDGERQGDSWGTLAAWAWGASRVADYLQTDEAIDAGKLAIVGHSRGGKTALWAGATDERWALVVSNNSGCGGAALSRDKEGETIAQINASFPHWFCENFRAYGHRENELPLDQHQLLALVAPRLLYVASASEDKWADPHSEFLAAVAASPVYRLWGAIGLPSPVAPATNVAMLGGRIGTHRRGGKHDLTPFDWARFLDFADAHGWNAELPAEAAQTEIPDPTYGHDLDALLQVGAPPAPPDFAEFWTKTYQQTLNVPLGIERREIESPDPNVRIWEIEFDSFQDFRAGGWLTVPRDGDFERALVCGHGYGGRSQPETKVAGPKAAVLFPCARGFDRSRRVALPDEAVHHVTHGIETRETYIHRGCIADLWASASVLLELFPHTKAHLHYAGGSFGGGIGALALAFDARFKRAHLNVPSFGNYPLRVQLPCNGSGRAVRAYWQRHPAVLEVLAYFDVATAARYIQTPTLVSPALRDASVPPPGQFAVYNALNGPKELWVRQQGHPTLPEDDAKLFEVVGDWFDVNAT